MMRIPTDIFPQTLAGDGTSWPVLGYAEAPRSSIRKG